MSKQPKQPYSHLSNTFPKNDDVSIQTRRKDYSQLQDVNFNESYYCNVGVEPDMIYEDHDFTYESDDSYVSVETSDTPLPPQKGFAISFPPRSSYNHLNQPFKTKTSDDTPVAVTKLPQKPQSKMPTNKQMNFFTDLSTSLQRYHKIDGTEQTYTPVYDDHSNDNEDPEYAEARDTGSQRSCLPLMQHYEELPDIGGPQLSETPPPAPPRIMLLPPNLVEKLPSPMKITRHLLTTVPEVTVKSPPSSQNHSREPTLAPSEEYIASSDEMSLGDFVSKYQDEFPVRVRVSRGYYGTSDKWSISEGEYFNVHFIKYTKVVSASDSSFGHYTIPINSSTEFGYLYMPHGNVDAGISGYDFSTVGEILQADRPPVLVTAMQTWQKGKSEQNSVNSNDVLLVQGSKGRVKRSLKCLNVKTGKQKLLQQTCAGMFTTRPYETRLFLPEVLKHFTLPAKFVIFINKDENPDLPSDIFSHPVNLSHCSIETSLIATQLDERITKESAPLIEIPMDLDIAVELVTPKADEVAQLYEDTGRLYRTLDIALLQTIPSNIDNLGSDPIAAEALITCHKEHKNVGIEIQQPPRYGIEFSKTSSNLQTRESYSYTRSTTENNTKTKVDTENKVCALELNLQRMDSTLRHYTEQMEGLQHQINELHVAHQKLHELCNSMQKEMEGFKNTSFLPNPSPQISPPRPPPFRSTKKSQTTNKDNFTKSIAALQHLTPNQVMKLLKGLGLPQYQPIFHTKRIDGKKLAKMEENDLRKLGVALEHQGKIMNVIKGYTPPHTLLD